MRYIVQCFNCRREYGQEFSDQWWLCPDCGGSLEVQYLQTATTLKSAVILQANTATIASTANVLKFPLNKKIGNVLGEGNTPLLFLSKLSDQFGLEIWAKCESQNPTGSFKDRGSVIEVTKALELGKKGVVCASTGNMAASLSAYAAKFDLKCKVVIPAITPEAKLQQATACGAELIKVDGPYDDCVGVAQAIAQKEDYFLCGDYLLRREGQKTIGYELANQGFDGFIVPVGNGNVGIAIAQGLQEAEAAKQESKLPKFIGIQAENVNPIEKAWKTGTEIKAMSGTKTIASAFNVGKPLEGALTLSWVEKTKGSLVTVTDSEIINAQALLAKKEGLYVESTATTTLAGLLKIKETLKGQKIVLILTGSGLKERR